MILDPSRGGIGNRLNIIKPRFTWTIKLRINANKPPSAPRPVRIPKEIKASTRFDSGPALGGITDLALGLASDFMAGSGLRVLSLARDMHGAL